jgi:hypothetical protein
MAQTRPARGSRPSLAGNGRVILLVIFFFGLSPSAQFGNGLKPKVLIPAIDFAFKFPNLVSTSSY